MNEVRRLSVVQGDVQGVDERPGALRYYAWLLARAGADGIVTVPEDEAAAALTVDVRTVRRWKRALVETDCIGVSRFGNRPNEYRLRRSLEAAHAALEIFTRRVRSMSSAMSSSTVSDEAGPQSDDVRDMSSAVSSDQLDTQSYRARDTSSSSWSSSPQDIQDMSGTTPAPTAEEPRGSVDDPSERFLHQAAVLQDPSHLLVAGLIRSQGIEDTAPACRAMAALTPAERLEALRLVMKAKRPNPDYLVKCCGTVLNLRGTTLPAPELGAPDGVPASSAIHPITEVPNSPAAVSFVELVAAALAVARALDEERGKRGAAMPVGTRRAAPAKQRDPFAIEVGDRLRTAREAWGGSQEAAAIAAGITQAALSNYERGKRVPPMRTLMSLATVLGTSAVALMPELARAEEA